MFMLAELSDSVCWYLNSVDYYWLLISQQCWLLNCCHCLPMH